MYGISGCWAVSNLSSLSLSSCQALLPQAHSLWCKADVSLPKETRRWKLSSHNTVAPFRDETFSCTANFPDPITSLILSSSCAYKYTFHCLFLNVLTQLAGVPGESENQPENFTREITETLSNSQIKTVLRPRYSK